MLEDRHVKRIEKNILGGKGNTAQQRHRAGSEGFPDTQRPAAQGGGFRAGGATRGQRGQVSSVHADRLNPRCGL